MEPQAATNPRVRLSLENVLEIFNNRPLRFEQDQTFVPSPRTSRRLANQFRISDRAVRDIWNRRSWRDVTQQLWSLAEVAADPDAAPSVDPSVLSQVRPAQVRRPGRPRGAADSYDRRAAQAAAAAGGHVTPPHGDDHVDDHVGNHETVEAEHEAELAGAVLSGAGSTLPATLGPAPRDLVTPPDHVTLFGGHVTPPVAAPAPGFESHVGAAYGHVTPIQNHDVGGHVTMSLRGHMGQTVIFPPDPLHSETVDPGIPDSPFKISSGWMLGRDAASDPPVFGAEPSGCEPGVTQAVTDGLGGSAGVGSESVVTVMVTPPYEGERDQGRDGLSSLPCAMRYHQDIGRDQDRWDHGRDHGPEGAG
mmetsp:Transcript_13984/g.28924  ORF Transcript_13984/g.28924 Transcript_13984/m.28924 type:complete len:362 (+) Transcript_13984:427-1512(+)